MLSRHRAFYSIVKEQRHSAWAYYFLALMFTHSDTTEKYRRSSKLSEVYCISLKLVKSNPVTYHMVYPYTWTKSSVKPSEDGQQEDSQSREDKDHPGVLESINRETLTESSGPSNHLRRSKSDQATSCQEKVEKER